MQSLPMRTVLKKYPKSKKAPGALLKQGFAFIELGDNKTGKVILEKLDGKLSGLKTGRTCEETDRGDGEKDR